MFPLKTDYTPRGPLAQIPASDLNTIGAILNTLQIDLGQIEKPATPTDSAPWRIKIREAILALIGSGGSSGITLPGGRITIPGRVEYTQTESESGEITPRLIQHSTTLSLADDGALTAAETGPVTLITPFTSHESQHSAQGEPA